MNAHAPIEQEPDLRALLSTAIELLIAICDQIDGDTDIEPDADLELEPDREMESDLEPSLGSVDIAIDQLGWARGGTDDIEVCAPTTLN